ncbi:predicted protein [Streptomyces albidoflavus]|nr:predicted protein [Streptomyces albidoflavus]PKA33940.1 universal stress protein [Streptomyces sp. SM8]
MAGAGRRRGRGGPGREAAVRRGPLRGRLLRRRLELSRPACPTPPGARARAAERSTSVTENATAPRPVIVAGVDGSPTSREALRWAAEEARLRTATLRVVCGWEWSSPFNLIGPALEYAAPDADTPSMEELTRAKVEELLTGTLGEEPGVPVEVRVVQGPATRVLVDASEGATLIVVGTRGHSGIKGAVLGSVSRHVTQHARCNVVVVRDSRDLAAGE